MVIRIAVVFLSAVSFFGTGARAQNVISIASTFVAPDGPVPKSCEDQATMLKLELSNFPFLPARWKWIIVCDDASWQAVLHRIHPRGQVLTIREFDQTFVEAIHASTNLDAGITLLRGTTILNPDNPLAHPDHVIAHELAHIVLHTTNEEEAEAQALTWLEHREPAYFSWVKSESSRMGGAPSQVKPDQPTRDSPVIRSRQPGEPGRSEPGPIDPRANHPTLNEASVRDPATPGQ